MTSQTAGFDGAGLTGSSSKTRSGGRLGPLSIVVLSAWCGLVAGLLETGVIIVRKRYLDPNHFYGMSRDFTWLVPLADCVLFLGMGLVLALIFCLGGRGRRMAPRALAALCYSPPFLVAFPRIYGGALLLLAMGVAARMVPALERAPPDLPGRFASLFLSPSVSS